MGCTNSNIPPEPKEADEIHIDSVTVASKRSSWSERHNSNREKLDYIRQKVSAAEELLENYITYKNIIYSRCKNCNKKGPDYSNKYYNNYYLVVDSIVCKSQCKKCKINFIYDVVGVKSYEDLMKTILDEGV